MAKNKIFNAGPLPLTSILTTDLLNPPVTSGGINGGAGNQFIVIRHIRVVNNQDGSYGFSLWRGATAGNAAGTECVGQEQQVAPYSSYDWYGIMRFDTNDYLVGGCSGSDTALTIQLEGEIGVH